MSVHPDSPIVLEASDLQVDVGGQSLLDVDSLALHRSRVLAVMGPNGSGKSTLVRVLGLLQNPTRGTIKLFGSAVTRRSNVRRLRRRMGVVFQQSLLLNASVRSNVESGLKIRGVGRDYVDALVGEWLEKLRIAELADRPAYTLSAGEAQRTSLARAFVTQPEILLMDEPFSMLDTPTREQLMWEVAQLLRRSAAATLFVTHDRDEALAIGDDLAVLMDGCIVQSGSVESVFARPLDLRVADFVGVENVIPGTVAEVDAGLATVQIGSVKVDVVAQVEEGGSVHVCVRPENVVVALASTAAETSARNEFTGEIVRIRPLGSQLRVEVNCGFELIAYVTRASAEELRFARGSKVAVSFKASAAHLTPRGIG